MDAEERAAYNEMDRNCNACKHLIRVDSPPKGKPYMLWHGKCNSPNPRFDVHPYGPKAYEKLPEKYKLPEGVFGFHPNDWMGMPCWEPRD